MEKRVVLAVVLTIAVIFLTNILFPPPAPPPPTDVPEPDTLALQRADTDTADVPGALGAGEDRVDDPGMERLPAADRIPEGDTIIVRSDLYELSFSTVGARLIGARLLGYESYAPRSNGDDRVQLIRSGDAIFGYRVAAAGDTASLVRRTFTASRDRIDLDSGSGTDSLRLAYEFPGTPVRFVVVYRFRPDSYVVEVAGRLEGFGEQGWSVLTSLGSGLPTNEKDPDEDYGQLALVTNGQAAGIESLQVDKIDPGTVETAGGGPFQWVAVKNKYFLIALIAP